MKNNPAIVVTLLCVVLLVGCVYPDQYFSTLFPVSSTPLRLTSQPDSTIDPSTVYNPTQSHGSSSTPVISETPTPVVTPSSQVPTRYNLDTLFDFNAHSLAVSEVIDYVNLTQDTIDNLVLMVEPNRWQGAFLLNSLTWEDGEAIGAYDLQNDQLQIPLSQSLLPNGHLKLFIDYQLLIPAIAVSSNAGRSLPYGYTDLQTNLVDWYPYIPAYRSGTGWLAHPPWKFGEHQVFSASDFNVRLTLIEPVENLVIAASAPAVQNGDSYSYHLEAARSFALSASTEYVVQTADIGAVNIYSYSFPYDKSAAQEVLKNTADALQLYSDLLVPYPHASLSIVEADFLDGMEYDGLFFLSHGFYDLYDGTPKGYLTFIAAHETAHQWWYGLVGNDQALEPWLDEALCTYMEYVFYENIYPASPGSQEETLADWWWYYRVDYYDPSGWVDSSIYDFDDIRAYWDGVYLNGAKFLEKLRNRVGDRIFFASLRDYIGRYTHQIATSDNFFSVLHDHTSQNFDDLISQFFQPAK
jgi:hypothetical protein